MNVTLGRGEWGLEASFKPCSSPGIRTRATATSQAPRAFGPNVAQGGPASNERQSSFDVSIRLAKVEAQSLVFPPANHENHEHEWKHEYCKKCSPFDHSCTPAKSFVPPLLTCPCAPRWRNGRPESHRPPARMSLFFNIVS